MNGDSGGFCDSICGSCRGDGDCDDRRGGEGQKCSNESGGIR